LPSTSRCASHEGFLREFQRDLAIGSGCLAQFAIAHLHERAEGFLQTDADLDHARAVAGDGRKGVVDEILGGNFRYVDAAVFRLLLLLFPRLGPERERERSSN